MNNGAIADKIEVTFFALTPDSLEISFVAVAEVPPIKCFTILAPSSRSTFFKNDATLEIRSFACVANASSNPSLFVLLAACLDAPSKSLGSADFNTFVTSEVFVFVTFPFFLPSFHFTFLPMLLLFYKVSANVAKTNYQFILQHFYEKVKCFFVFL